MKEFGPELTREICERFIAADGDHTTRSIAAEMGVSKTAVYLHLKYYSRDACPSLYPKVAEILERNKFESRFQPGVPGKQRRRKK